MNEEPRSLNEFIGQKKATERLRNWIAYARRHNTRLPHLLLLGPTGLGKSVLAKLVADELGVTFRKVSPGKARAKDVLKIINDDPALKDRDVLLIEEAHAAFQRGETSSAWMLDTLLESTILNEPIPQITFMLATHVGIPFPAFRGRLMEIRLKKYIHPEAIQLVYYYAGRILHPWPPPTTAQAEAIARAGAHNPRSIISILHELRIATEAGDIAQAHFSPEQYDVRRVLKLMDITADGLDAVCREYLMVLSEIYGGTAGKDTMKAHLAEARLDEVEALLIAKKLLQRTGQGRQLTELGRVRASQLLGWRRRSE